MYRRVRSKSDSYVESQLLSYVHRGSLSSRFSSLPTSPDTSLRSGLRLSGAVCPYGKKGQTQETLKTFVTLQSCDESSSSKKVHHGVIKHCLKCHNNVFNKVEFNTHIKAPQGDRFANIGICTPYTCIKPRISDMIPCAQVKCLLMLCHKQTMSLPFAVLNA